MSDPQRVTLDLLPETITVPAPVLIELGGVIEDAYEALKDHEGFMPAAQALDSLERAWDLVDQVVLPHLKGAALVGPDGKPLPPGSETILRDAPRNGKGGA